MHLARIAELLQPFLREANHQRLAANDTLCQHISTYIDILLHWNARINLTAIRSEEEIVTRHFGESLFAARHLFPNIYPVSSVPPVLKEVDLDGTRLADLGSGAGFPGIPIALIRPEISVTLAESQNKKSSFLREAVRTLKLPNVEVWAARAETLPADRQFRIVTLRAVDNMEDAITVAKGRIAPGGQLALLTTVSQVPNGGRSLPLPNSKFGILYLQTF